MGEERIKSAFEIAMEKISGLPELTPEEIAGQKEKEFKPIGEALSRKYLTGIISERELQVELNRHDGDKSRIIRKAFITNLCLSIRLDDPSQGDKVLKGIAQLFSAKDTRFKKAERDLEEVMGGFKRESLRKIREFETMAREKIKEAGVSGSAVRPNVSAYGPWQDALLKLHKAYEPRLNKIINTLIMF